MCAFVALRRAKACLDGMSGVQFLDLKRESMETVAKDMGEGTTVEELVKTVEELSRSCH